MTKCGSCNGYSFKLSRLEPSGSRFAFYAIQCSSCGVAIAVTDFNNVPATLEVHNNKLTEINSVVSELSARVQHMERILVDLANRQ